LRKAGEGLVLTNLDASKYPEIVFSADADTLHHRHFLARLHRRQGALSQAQARPEQQPTNICNPSLDICCITPRDARAAARPSVSGGTAAGESLWIWRKGAMGNVSPHACALPVGHLNSLLHSCFPTRSGLSFCLFSNIALGSTANILGWRANIIFAARRGQVA
jgi:hypothetical protein